MPRGNKVCSSSTIPLSGIGVGKIRGSGVASKYQRRRSGVTLRNLTEPRHPSLDRTVVIFIKIVLPYYRRLFLSLGEWAVLRVESRVNEFDSPGRSYRRRQTGFRRKSRWEKRDTRFPPKSNYVDTPTRLAIARKNARDYVRSV